MAPVAATLLLNMPAEVSSVVSCCQPYMLQYSSVYVSAVICPTSSLGCILVFGTNMPSLLAKLLQQRTCECVGVLSISCG